MKIRSPFLLKILGFVIAWVVRVLLRSMRYRYHSLGPNVIPTRRDLAEKFIYAIWHENLIQPVYHYCGLGICVLISKHEDGQLLTEVCRHMNIRTIRGSTRRGGITAVRQLMQIARETSLAITPDGPRGPRRKVQDGLIYLASQTGLPIVPVGFGSYRPWRLKSWDRLAIPRPGSLGTCVTGTPIAVPPQVDRLQSEYYRQLVENAMLLVSDLAEQWAQTGRKPVHGVEADTPQVISLKVRTATSTAPAEVEASNSHPYNVPHG